MMEKEPNKHFSLEDFIKNNKKEEAGNEYGYGDPGAPAHNLEMILKKVPDRILLVEKILNPRTQEEELYIAVNRLDKMNADSAIEEGLYESVGFQLKNHIPVEFRLFQNGTFVAILNNGIVQPIRLTSANNN